LAKLKEPFILDGLVIRRVEGTHNSISFNIGTAGPFPPGLYGWRNVILRDIYFHDDDAGCRHPNVAKCQEYGLTKPDFKAQGGCPGSLVVCDVNGGTVPAIAYTNDLAYDWGFDYPKDWMGPLGMKLQGDPKTNVGMEGWGQTCDLDAHVSAGALRLVITGPQARISSPDHLGLDGGAFRTIQIGFANHRGKSVAARLRFISRADEVWDDPKSVPITFSPDTANLKVDLGKVNSWRSSPVKQLRLDFADRVEAGCALDLDFVRIAR
jgi:hypothetical protein